MSGGPFEESKRSWVPFLLYVGTIPLIFQLLDTIYGTWVSTGLSANCWDMEKQASVATFARVLVFVNWLFCFLAL